MGYSGCSGVCFFCYLLTVVLFFSRIFRFFVLYLNGVILLISRCLEVRVWEEKWGLGVYVEYWFFFVLFFRCSLLCRSSKWIFTLRVTILCRVFGTFVMICL